MSAYQGVAEVSVRDQGNGIPKVLQSRIFQKFVQGPPESAGKIAGAGLGLSIAKAIIDAHGSTIDFETDSSGTRMFFRLPVA